MHFFIKTFTLLTGLFTALQAWSTDRPNIVLVMTDDQGWGQTGYYNHPILKTPNLDEMAANGLRFDHFYAAPNCSPTRATVLTGRSNDRTGVLNHGYPLRKQEKTLPQAMRNAGYATGHFGKWHLNGFSGPGVPILKTDDHGPGHFGFDEWLSVSNFFDRDPLMSRNGEFESFAGDSSEIIVNEALKFIREHAKNDKPFFAVIWYGTPHGPWVASEEDCEPFKALSQKEQHHYGELVAMDRSIGALRRGLREVGCAENTLVWFNSDNGGLPNFGPETVGSMRGHKNTPYEGGIRVPAIIEWPAVIQPRITDCPAVTMDIFPTIADIVGLPSDSMLKPCDGMSIYPLFEKDTGPRSKPIPIRHTERFAWIDNEYKLVIENGKTMLFNLNEDPKETTDISTQQPETANRLKTALAKWNTEVDASMAGKDYPEGRVNPGEPERQAWAESKEYAPYLDEFKKRTTYKKPKKKK